ncbi:YmiA family putative membrane protein [Martelella alba]|uniref:YmiA family putative membrane protein n=1 Tax=Martelella alba TaxID=2590451 RepID=A0ABY2SJ49_9HYPH|nr:YmiA family putative membrane protein [Martelella alba]
MMDIMRRKAWIMVFVFSALFWAIFLTFSWHLYSR